MARLTLSSKNQIVLPKGGAAGDESQGRGSDIGRGERKRDPPDAEAKKYAKALSGSGKGLYPKRYLKTERRSW